MTVVERVPSHALTPAELVARIKADHPREDPKALYGRYVQERALRPDIDARDFRRLYDLVAPNPYVRVREIDFAPTHRDTMLDVLVQATPTEYGHALVWEHGMTGHEPGPLSERYRPLEEA